jgi:hypothetical protein
VNDDAKPKQKRGKQCITKRKRENPIRTNPFGAFDFETTGLDGVVVFGTLQSETSVGGIRCPVRHVYGADAMFDSIVALNKPKMRWYAHNLEFDLYFLLHEIQKRIQRGEVTKVELCERGLGNFYRCIVHLADGSKLDIYDSMAVFGFSLKYFLASFSTVGNKLELDFEKETFDINNPAHIEYAEQDTRGLLDAMINFDAAMFKLFGVHLKGTISSTALAAWETTLKQDERFYKLTAAQNEFCREGYFGGLVFLTSTDIHADVVSVDVNSMYPHCMRSFGVPVGRPTLTKQFDHEKPGIYKALFKAPTNLHFGCVGYRDKHGIAWPRGEFETTCFDFEIERALAWGYTVEIKRGLVFSEYAYPFNDFVDNCETARAEHKGTPFEIVVKLAQNSVYGKFGTKPDGAELVIFDDQTEIDPGENWTPYVNPKTGSLVFDGLMRREVERDTYYMLPHWAAHITARARGELLDIVELCEGAALYGDTDSVKMPREIYDDLVSRGTISVGIGYGQLKLDDEYDHFKAIAPKVYTYVSKNKHGGRGKGIPEKQRTADFWQKIYNGERPTVEYKTLQSLKTALKNGGERKLKNAHRASTDLNNSPSWTETNGRVRSITIKNGEREK